ncbi:Fc receptor-like protein 5 [Choloepus didactylus]|uniref:Fc receptor-like protein 5 n=1 Tax=Choloepus didactylus TaxID=27675 RepID=UPI0018A0B7CC|nr:Fc receptor-like protein 5 [Choloepus didactylus]
MACLLESASFFGPWERASVLLWASVLILAPVSGQLATTPRPVISLQPPWTRVFLGETVLLTCKELHDPAPGQTKWYRWYQGNNMWSESSENTLDVHVTGQYKCQVQDSPLSKPVNLLFSPGPIILQAPHSVFEGDTLVLRCKKKGKEKLNAVKYYWNGKMLSHLNKSMDLLIPQARSNNSGQYWCTGSGSRSKNDVFRSSQVLVRIQELFPLPDLKATASQPKEGSSVNLTCETQLPLERWDTRLHFVFFRDNGVILSDWSRSPELQIPVIWRENSGSYWCEAEAVAHSVRKRSLLLQIRVQRVPVSGVHMETQPPGAQVAEGEKLVLICSVVEGTGNTTFSWHREGSGNSLGKKALCAQRAELEIPVVWESDAGGYFCVADNDHGPIQSEVVTITVRGTPGNRSGHIAAVVAGGSLSILLLTTALLFYCWHQRKSGDSSLGDVTRSSPTPGPGDPVELRVLYGKVNSREEDLVYSEIQIIHLGEEAANLSRTPPEDQHVPVVYSEVKTKLPDDLAGKISSEDEDALDSYENVLLMFSSGPHLSQIFMLLWLSLLVLAPVSEQLATVPVISLHPSWTTVFQGETVLLTCNGFHDHPTEKTKWHHKDPENHRATDRETPGNTLEVNDSGVYRCQVQNSPLSNPVNLIFTSASLILQAPPSVFEGDEVVLRCRAKEQASLSNLTLYKNGKVLQKLSEGSDFHIYQAGLKDNGQYHCTGLKERDNSASSNTVKIQVQDLFPQPQLTGSPSWVLEGSQVTLTCETQLPPQRSDTKLQFSFFKEDQPLKSGWSSSPEIQITALWKKDSGDYQCNARAVNSDIQKQSARYHVEVQRGAANVQIHTRPDLEWVFEGKELVLTCSVYGVPGHITFSWYRSKQWHQEEEIPNSRGAELKISRVRSSDAGEYSCKASNGNSFLSSKAVTINVKIPVSHPVLTFRPHKAQALEGDEMTLHCEAQTGSPLILFQFYHESVILANIEASSRSAHFSLTLTAKHSGNYHCTADNGLGVQRSEVVVISVTVPVSHPVLTLRTSKAKALEGDMVTLHCEAQRGSPRILYQLFHKGKLLETSSALSGGGASFRFSLTTESSGNYHCTADNGFGPQHSEAVSISVVVLVSRPVLNIRVPRAQAVVGDMVELHCEAKRGSPPIQYRFYHEYDTLGIMSSPSGGGASFSFSLTAEHSGNYYCTADNGLGVQRSVTVPLNVRVPVSRPVLTLRAPRAQAVVGDVVELHCEAQRGSPPILYRFYHKNVTLGSRSASSGGGASFNLFVTPEHSGNYFCESENSLGAQRSEVVPLDVTVPVSRPVLTLRAPRAQAVVGDVVELHCEAQRGSPPILYRFYHKNVTLGSRSVPSGGGASFNLSLTAEHSGNYSCEAENGLGPQPSEVVILNIRGLTGNRSGHIVTGVTGGLLSTIGLAAAVLVVYCVLMRKAGKKSASDPTRSPPNLDTQEPTYHNVPASIELQPVYSNVNPNGRDVVYSEVRSIPKQKKHAAASTPGLLKDKDSSVIYSQVKVASTPAT